MNEEDSTKEPYITVYMSDNELIETMIKKQQTEGREMKTETRVELNGTEIKQALLDYVNKRTDESYLSISDFSLVADADLTGVVFSCSHEKPDRPCTKSG